MVSSDNHSHGETKGLSPFVCACFTLNYIIGTGFLALPWAFERAGILLSAFGMVAVCIVANTASNYILSSMAICDAIATKTLQTSVNEQTALLPLESQYPFELDTNLNEQSSTNGLSHENNGTSLSASGRALIYKAKHSMDLEKTYTMQDGKLLVGDRKFDIPEMCKLFLGNTGMTAYAVALSLDVYGFLWAYTSVFASSMAKALPLFEDDASKYYYLDSYPIYVVVFACIVVPMSLLELSEQASFQVLLSACRIVMMLCMVFTPLVATIMGIQVDPKDGVPHFGYQLRPNRDCAWFDPSHIHQMLPIIVFCVLFHQAVPGLADEVTDKSKLSTIFGLTFILCGFCYSLIGVIDAFYFGEGILESANLNWKNYHGGTGMLEYSNSTNIHGSDHKWVNVALWAKLISFFVVVFPALDVISVFPLNAFVLGNNLMDFTYRGGACSVQVSKKMRCDF